MTQLGAELVQYPKDSVRDAVDVLYAVQMPVWYTLTGVLPSGTLRETRLT